MNVKRSKFVLVLVCIIIFLSSCEDQEERQIPIDKSPNLIINVIENDPMLSLLSEAILFTDLTDILINDSDYTFFAPNNNALSQFIELRGASTLVDLDRDELRNILMYHLTDGLLVESEIMTDYVETWNNSSPDESYVSMYINADTGVRLNNKSDIVIGNVDAENGVLHIVDEVLEIPTIKNIISDNEEFSTLRTVIQRVGLDEQMSSDKALTFFAPNNEAFERFLVVLSLESLDDIPDDTLRDIVQYHFIESNIKKNDFRTGKLNTLNPKNDIEVEIGTDIRINNHVTLTNADIQSANGVVHMIDEVLLPSS